MAETEISVPRLVDEWWGTPSRPLQPRGFGECAREEDSVKESVKSGG